ncbi:MAG TPA: CinA family nicotinamide mononucleotide deamidase-related protein [Candidatus Polarisedimenticolia bacterium]|jgi:nicotinamide-nucleotide amidase
MSGRGALRTVVIAIGTELLEDGRPDTNGVFVSRMLASRGIRTARRVQVGDDEEEIASALRQAGRDFPVVVVTGGLGPTIDDVTREALSRAFDLDLVEEPALLEEMARRYRSRGREMNRWAARQALLPRGARALPNAGGTAPGIVLGLPAGGLMVLLPGVPHEMERMMREQVLPLIEELGPAGAGAARALAMKVSGLTEMEVQERIIDLFDQGSPREGPSLTLLASPAEISVIVRGDDAPRVDSIFRQIRERLGEAVFGEDLEAGLETAVGRLLSSRGLTLACAESCTGGMMGAMATRVPGSSAWFLQGWVTYSDEAKRTMLQIDAALIERHGAVSAEIAMAMALAARRLSGADIGAAITGIAGPEGGSAEKPVGLVHIAVATRHGCRQTRHLFPGDREAIRLFASRTALNRVRLEAP